MANVNFCKGLIKQIHRHILSMYKHQRIIFIPFVLCRIFCETQMKISLDIYTKFGSKEGNEVAGFFVFSQ